MSKRSKDITEEIERGTIIEETDASNIIDNYFLGYAEYTISDRAIPKIEDGLNKVNKEMKGEK